MLLLPGLRDRGGVGIANAILEPRRQRPGDSIIATAKDRAIDLIVLGRTPSDPLSRWLIGSTSEAVLGRATASVLIVPVEK